MSESRIGRRRSAVLVVFALALAGMVAAVAPASATGRAQDGPPEQVLERDMRGEEAIRALGQRLPEVAALNDMTPAEFRAAVRADSMLWVSQTGRLLWVDEFGFGGDHDHADTAVSPWESASMPSGTDVFALESRPTATRVIVLDFNGHDARGTVWGSSGKQVAAAYDTDGNSSNWSQTEKEQVYSVWQRVAEDYAPFDVNVTTKDFPHVAYKPGHSAIRRDTTGDTNYGTRVVITPSQTYSCRCGGVAYYEAFAKLEGDHDSFQPAWVFTGGVGNGAKNIAEAASHEAGHNLNLKHDGTSSSGYYKGHGDWAPIMGVGYYEPITQWSQGEYANANNGENDFDVVRMSDGSTARGIVLVGDEPDTALGAVSQSTSLGGSGIISGRTDVDTFTFSTTGATVTVHANPAAVSPNLDIEMELLGGTGTLAKIDPSSAISDGNDVSAGLDALYTGDLANGTYTVRVRGAAFGDVTTTGYSTYGSVGRYSLTVSTGTTTNPPPQPDPEPDTVPTPTDLATSVSGDVVTVSWKHTSSTATFNLERQQKSKGSWISTTPLNADAGTLSFPDTPGSGTFRYRIQAVDGTAVSEWSGWVEASTGGNKPSKGGNGKASRVPIS